MYICNVVVICFHKNCPGLLVKLALNACVWFGRVYIFSVITVVEYHSGADEFQYIFSSNWAASKDFLISCKRTWFRVVKDSRFSVFNVNFEPKMNVIILKMIFVLEYQTRRTTFSNNIVSFIHDHQILFSKNLPYFCWLSTKLSCKISKNPLRMFIWM